MRITKRDGSIQKFDEKKIVRAILSACHDVRPGNINVDVNRVTSIVTKQLAGRETVTVEEVQDRVVATLYEEAYGDVAEGYQSFREERTKLREQRLEPDPSLIKAFIAAGKYAKYSKDFNRFETWDDTTMRCRAMFLDRFPQCAGTTMQAFEYVREGKLLPSMRAMQFGGKGVWQHNARLYNCAFSLANRLRFFQEAFYCLLCGCGVGFSVQYHHVAGLPEVKTIDRDRVTHIVIEDSIEGWADSVGQLIRSYFVTGEYTEFAYTMIRDKGEELSTSGGKAPGHLPLKDLHEQMRKFLDSAAGRKLRPIEVFDIVCIIAEAVLSGGIRRSSLIALFSPDDGEMVHAKVPGNYEWGGKNYWRRMANISAACLRDAPPVKDYIDRLIKTARAYGEPGVVWLSDPDAGCNPCAEIGLFPRLSLPSQYVRYEPHGTDLAAKYNVKLEPHNGVIVKSRDSRIVEQVEVDRSLDYIPASNYDSSTDFRAISTYGHDTGFQFCNLCDVNVAACKDETEFLRVCAHAAALGTMQAAFTDFPYLGPVTERITRREALIGVGLTGMCDKPSIAFDPKILRRGAEVVKGENASMAKTIGINPSARCTTVKPSGTSSLVLGCVGSGIHPHHARRYFRRVTESPTSPVVKKFREVNPHMVEVKPDGNLCVTFCVKAPDAAMTVKEMPAAEFMELVFLVYDHWVKPGTREQLCVIPGMTHNVSCTVVVGENEWDIVTTLAWENKQRVASMSFLPRFGDKGIPYMPREEVTTPEDETRWKHIIENARPVDYSSITEVSNRTAEPACVGGACEI